MISRRNFLKGLGAAIAGVGILPYLPKELPATQPITLQPATIKPSSVIYGVAGERIKAGQAVWIGPDGRFYPATNGHFSGIAIDERTIATSGVVSFGAPLDKSYYLKAGE